jgi:hypothetical protein
MHEFMVRLSVVIVLSVGIVVGYLLFSDFYNNIAGSSNLFSLDYWHYGCAVGLICLIGLSIDNAFNIVPVAIMTSGIFLLIMSSINNFIVISKNNGANSLISWTALAIPIGIAFVLLWQLPFAIKGKKRKSSHSL